MKETNDSCVEISCKSQKIHQASKKTQPQNCSYTVDVFSFQQLSYQKKPPYGIHKKNTTPLHRNNRRRFRLSVSPSNSITKLESRSFSTCRKHAGGNLTLW